MFVVEDARRLAAVRIGLCTLLAVRLADADYGVVAGQPAALFQPHGYMTLLDRMPSQSAATALQVAGVVAALLAAAGLMVVVSLPVGIGCALVLNGMLNSAGRVIVGDAVLVLCLIVLAGCGRAAGEAWSIRAPTWRVRTWTGRGAGAGPPRSAPIAAPPPIAGRRYGWPIRTAMVAIALAYFFAGYQKWRHSGIAWVTSDNIRWILYAANDAKRHPNGVARFVADRTGLAHVIAAAALLLETSFPLVLLVPRLRWVLISGAVAMHIGVWLALGLDYSAQALTVVIVFVDWPAAVAHFRRSATCAPR